jgi:hypothetical protein
MIVDNLDSSMEFLTTSVTATAKGTKPGIKVQDPTAAPSSAFFPLGDFR